jgi:hypothetical protein
MFGQMILVAAMVGQVAADEPRTGPVLSEQAKKAQARALAEFRANEHTIKPRLEAYYRLENQRLTEKTATVNVATSRVLYFAAGARSEDFGVAGGTSGFSSVPPTAPRTARTYQGQPSLSELQRENLLVKWRLRDSQSLYRQANCLYWAEFPIRMRLATTPFGQR